MILAQLFPMFPLDTPEYIKKLKVFRRFQGGPKDNIGKKWIKDW